MFEDLNDEEIDETFYEKELQKTKQHIVLTIPWTEKLLLQINVPFMNLIYQKAECF